MASETVVVFNHFPDIAKKLPEVLGQLIEAACAHIESNAKTAAPVKTGFMRDSGAHQMTGPTSGEVTFSAPYSGFVELGTVHQAAQPFLLPAGEPEPGALAHAFRGRADHLRLTCSTRPPSMPGCRPRW